MNLIEKLGGYESAYKFHLDRVNSHKTFIYDGLDKELLNYRRENNIFEENDKVVYIYDCENSMLFSVRDITEKGYSFGNDWGWYGVISNTGVGYTFRHATDEEIKAGCRLDSVQY